MTSADVTSTASSSSVAMEAKQSQTTSPKIPFSHVLTPLAVEALKTYQDVTFERHYSETLPAPIPSTLPSFEWKDMTIESVLGQGSFSFVFQVNCGGNAMALKCLKASSVERPEDLVCNAMDLYSEANLLERLNHNGSHLTPHPHIIQLMGTCRNGLADSFTSDDGYFVLLEIMQDTLQERLNKWRKEPEDAVFLKMVEKPQIQKRLEQIALPVCNAMEYLHSQGIVVRDLKPENIGFDQHGQVKLFDFGLARSVHLLQKDGEEENELAGSILYMAPEVLQLSNSTPTTTRGCVGFPCDVYSFAVLLWELSTLEVPLCKFRTLEEVKLNVGQKKYRPNTSGIPSSKIKSLLQQAWKHNPKDRPTFGEIKPQLETIITGTDGSSGNRSPKKRSFSKIKLFGK